MPKIFVMLPPLDYLVCFWWVYMQITNLTVSMWQIEGSIGNKEPCWLPPRSPGIGAVLTCSIQGSMKEAAVLLRVLQADRWSPVFPTTLSTAAHWNTKGKACNNSKAKSGEWQLETIFLKIAQTVSWRYNIHTAIFAHGAGRKQR